jgi:flagellin-like protein
MWILLREKLPEALKAVAPLIGVIILLQVTLVHAPAELFIQFLVGAVLGVLGMLLLFAGIDLGILPMGRFIGAELPLKGSIALIVVVAFSLGFAVTVAEPDVLVLAGQVDEVSKGAASGRAVMYVVALGVAVFVAAAMARIVLGWSMRALLSAAYGLVIVLALAGPAQFVPLAFDAGSVTTGVLSAPVIIALALGLSSVLAGRSTVSDGFGLLGFASIGPIVAVLLMGLLLS